MVAFVRFLFYTQPNMIDLQGTSVVYITRDIERALGLSLDTPGYTIISNATDFAKSVASTRNNVILIDSEDV